MVNPNKKEKDLRHLRNMLGEVYSANIVHQGNQSLLRLGNLLKHYGTSLEDKIAIGGKDKKVSRFDLSFEKKGIKYYPHKGVLIGITDESYFIYFIPKEQKYLAVERPTIHHEGGGWANPAWTKVHFKKHIKINPTTVILNLNVARQLRAMVAYLKQPKNKREEYSLSHYLQYRADK